MRHHFRFQLLTAVLLAQSAALHAGEAVATAPAVVMSATCPDLARTRERIATSLWGRIYAMPALATLRTAADAQMAEAAKTLGIDPNLLIADVACAESLVILPAPGAAPLPAGRVRFPATIALAMQALAARPGAVTAGDGVVTLGEAAYRRSGEWLLIGAAGKAVAEPPRVAPLEPDSDLSGRLDFTTLVRAMPTEPAPKRDPQRVLAALGLSTMDVHFAFAPDGTHERLELAGVQLPLAPLDGAALASLPAQPLVVWAAGLDGAKLAAMADRVVAAGGETGGFTEVDAQLAALKLPGVDAILAGLHGTAWLAVLNGAPFPSVTLAVPASPEIDACVAALGTRLGFDAVAARSQAVVLQLPARLPVLVQLRRTATHWVVGSDAELLDRLGAGAAGGYALPPAQPGALPALGLFTLDQRGLGQLLLSYLPLMMQGMLATVPPDQQQVQRKNLLSFQQGLAAALPLLGASTAVATQAPVGATITARNLYVVTPILAGMLLPTIGLVREQANRTKTGRNLSQIVGALIAYETQEEKTAPDLATLAKAMSLPKTLFIDPSAPAIAAPYLYVRAFEPSAQQPFILQDPACTRGKGMTVAYGDSHVGFIKAPAAQRLWAEAQRLAASPKAAAGGITLADWAAVFDILHVDPQEVEAADPPAAPAPALKPEPAPIP